MNVDGIPAELRALDQWLIWRYQQRPGQAKPTKIPYRALDPHRKASSTDPASWARFQDALAAVAAADGIGFVFSADDPYCGIDLDGFDQQEHMRIVKLFDSYTERSVSGGLHIILNGQLPGSGRHPADFGVFDRGRYFVVTGDHLGQTPTQIGERQPELDEFLEIYLPPAPEPAPPRPVTPIPLDDQQLLEKAFASRTGTDFQRLYHGDTSGYSSASEADLALCRTAAFWTGLDPTRIDTWLRTSGLMRDKWERADYRERTIELAIATTNDVYTPPQHPPDTNAETTNGDGNSAATITIEPLRAFLTRELPPVEALAGVTRNGTNLLPRYGWIMPWGREGCGKTSILVDLLFHLAAGLNWLHYHVARPVRVVAVINEGIPGGLQDKLAHKLELWQGDRDPILDNLAVYASPWGEFSFRNTTIVDHARDYTRDFGADLVALDPLHTLGTSGAGSPQETEEFKNRLRDFGLWDNLGIITAHHSNKTGMVSGDWSRHPDTVLRLEKDGKSPATKITLEKARPADPAELGVPMILEWATETMGYRRIELPTPEIISDADLLERINDYLLEQPSAVGITTLKEDVQGDPIRLGKVVKDALERGEIINESTHKGRFALRHHSAATYDDLRLDHKEP